MRYEKAIDHLREHSRSGQPESCDTNTKGLYTLSHHGSVVSCEGIFAEMESRQKETQMGRQTDTEKDLGGA